MVLIDSGSDLYQNTDPDPIKTSESGWIRIRDPLCMILLLAPSAGYMRVPQVRCSLLPCQVKEENKIVLQNEEKLKDKKYNTKDATHIGKEYIK